MFPKQPFSVTTLLVSACLVVGTLMPVESPRAQRYAKCYGAEEITKAQAAIRRFWEKSNQGVPRIEDIRIVSIQIDRLVPTDVLIFTGYVECQANVRILVEQISTGRRMEQRLAKFSLYHGYNPSGELVVLWGEDDR